MTDKERLKAMWLLLNPCEIIEKPKPIRTNTRIYIANKVHNDLNTYLIIKGYKKNLS